MTRPLIIPPGAAHTVTAFGSAIDFKLEGKDTGGALCLGIATTPPGVGPPLHVHQQDDELFIVIEGELSFQTPDGPVSATAGTVVFLPRGVPHTFRNTGSAPSRHWVLTAPSGFEAFYARCAELFANGPPPPDEIGAIAAEYGYQFLGPPPKG